MRRTSATRAATSGTRALAALVLLAACAAADESPVAEPSGPPDTGPSEPGPSGTEEPPQTGGPSASTSLPGGELPAYSATVRRIGPALAQRMQDSHRAGCPVPLEDLRYLRLSHVDFQGRPRSGELVVHRDHARPVTEVFESLYEARWPIRRMRLVDEYSGDDDASMAADNTSAYNCRTVAGTDRWSDHAYGAAIDLNPVENPYVRDGSVSPPEGERFARLDRGADARVPPGVIRAEDVVVRAFARIGWEWGGDWVSAKDYQHFAAPGG
jgi:hypothetical protein